VYGYLSGTKECAMCGSVGRTVRCSDSNGVRDYCCPRCAEAWNSSQRSFA
jgi:endogenous inhibitor of DNA gyrase (YacG/DUF329 family)